MPYSLRLTKIHLKNFIGIETGLGRNELTVDFDKLKDKNIICILGDNGTGKSTFSSVLHPLPGTTDRRNKFIIEGKDGLKKVWYERSDGVEYLCKIIYTESKTGHSVKCYLKKTMPNGDEVELNPNGNVSSYKDIIESELGISDAFLKLASQNDVCKGHVDMTSTERKVNIATFLPDDIYSEPFSVVDKVYKEMKVRINILVDAIGKLHDDETITLELERITASINKLVEKRDKCIGKIKEYETRIDIFKSEDVLGMLKMLTSEMNKIQRQISDIKSDLSMLIDIDKIYDIDIDADINNTNTSINSLNTSITVLNEKIKSLKINRNELSEDLHSKKSMFSEISTNKSLSELTELLDTYTKRLDFLEREIGKLDSSVTKNDFMIGYKIVYEIRNCIDNILSSTSISIIEEAVSDNVSDDIASLDDKYNELNSLSKDKLTIENSIINLNKDSELKDILDKRPKDCVIDDCPFINNAKKWISIEKQLSELTKSLENVNSKISVISNEVEHIEEVKTIHDDINRLWSYIELNIDTISKLPYSDKYSSYKSLCNAFLTRGKSIEKCDDFEPFIEIIESRDEYQDLKLIKIPSVQNNINIVKVNGKYIEDNKNEIARLEKKIESIQNDIADAEYELDKKRETNESLNIELNKYNKIKNLKDTLTSLMGTLNDKINLYSDFDKKKDELNEYLEKLADKKERLKEIDSDLQPLTRERELYKMEQLKVADHKQELAALNSDMFKCEVIRSALSVKDDGIPVDVLDYFMESIRTNANALLSGAFNGNLYLDEFVINSKDFIIPYQKNGNSGLDVSFASSSERSFVSLALTLSIMEEIMSDRSYGTVILDEIDRGFASAAKYKFIEILDSEISRTNITQVFMVTHNSNFYEGHNIGYILFPGADIGKIDNDDCIKINDDI